MKLGPVFSLELETDPVAFLERTRVPHWVADRRPTRNKCTVGRGISISQSCPGRVSQGLPFQAESLLAQLDESST